MFKKVLIVMCLSACVLWLPTAVSAAAPPNTAASPPDTAASVNGTPNGVWSTAALAKANSSQVVSAAADGNGCVSGYGCGWINSNFLSKMGKWAGPNPAFSAFGQPLCQEGNWNDCISSVDNNGTSGCKINWWWDVGHTYGNVFVDHQHVAYSSLGSANDKFSSDDWC